MKGLKVGALPWKRMTERDVVDSKVVEEPEDSYDVMRATQIRTVTTKPRTTVLADFGKQQARDDALYKTSDAFANVELENTKE